MALAALVEEEKNKLRLGLPRASNSKEQKGDTVSYSILKGKWKSEEEWKVGETNPHKREKVTSLLGWEERETVSSKERQGHGSAIV